MKTLKNIIAIMLLVAIPMILTAQPQPYDSGIGGGEGSNPVGGGASITGGLVILFSLGLGYGARRVYDYRKRLSE